MTNFSVVPLSGQNSTLELPGASRNFIVYGTKRATVAGFVKCKNFFGRAILIERIFMKFINQKDKKVFKIITVSLLILWNLILSAGVIFLHQRINNDIKTSGEINVNQMNYINELNQRIKKLEQK